MTETKTNKRDVTQTACRCGEGERCTCGAACACKACSCAKRCGT